MLQCLFFEADILIAGAMEILQQQKKTYCVLTFHRHGMMVEVDQIVFRKETRV